GAAYSVRIEGSRADNLEAAIHAYEQALTGWRQRDFGVVASPSDPNKRAIAIAWINLGSAYRLRIKGSKADNLEAAIEAIEAVVTFFADDPLHMFMLGVPRDEWAGAQMNLGLAYLDRVRGSKAENVEAAFKALEAAQTLFTREAHPAKWAETQNG